MTADGSLDYCNGCAVMGSRRINLPEGWSEGDPLPLGLTVHQTPRERANGNKPFAFIGDPARQVRHYFDEAVLTAVPKRD